jgi:hypothetical protein
MDLTNDDNIENKMVAAAGDDEDVTVSSLDIDLPLEPLVNFQKMLKSSEETQKALEQWDKKMGLKRSHSKTMWVSARYVGGTLCCCCVVLRTSSEYRACMSYSFCPLSSAYAFTGFGQIETESQKSHLWYPTGQATADIYQTIQNDGQ